MATALQSNVENHINGSNNILIKEEIKQEIKNEENDEACAISSTSSYHHGSNENNVAVAEVEQEDVPEVDIEISNVVCSFSVRCHLNLREIAINGCNVEYRREQGMVTMKLRKPYTTASIWSSGKITVTGATTEQFAYLAARRVARTLQKLGFNAKFSNFRIVNVLGSCSMPFNIKIAQFSERHKNVASYEPELHPGVTYRIKGPPKATLKIFSTGSITVTGAPSVLAVQGAIEHIFPLVQEFSSERTPEQIEKLKNRDLKRQLLQTQANAVKKRRNNIATTASDSEEGGEEDDECESNDDEDRDS